MTRLRSKCAAGYSRVYACRRLEQGKRVLLVAGETLLVCLVHVAVGVSAFQ